MLTAPIAPTSVALRVLLVDDRRRVNRRLRKHLRAAGWHVEVVRSAESAYAAARASTFDAVLCCLDPGERSGGDLLRDLKQAAPTAVRIVLADDAPGGGLARLAHQVVSPEDGDQVVASVETATHVVGLLDRADLRELVVGVDRLPGAPRVHAQLTGLLEERPDADLTDVAAVIERDAAIAAKVLQLVNSAFFGRAMRTASIADAASFLGLTALRGLVLHHELMRTFRSTDRARNRFLEDFARHGYDVAVAARAIAAPGAGGEAFTAGLLHDIGQLVLASQRPHEWARIRQQVALSGASLVDVEREHLGVCHAEVGAALLALWALPYPVVEAVAFHHAPQEAGSGFGLVGVLHVADAIRNDRPDGPSFDHGTGLDRRWLSSTGVDLDSLSAAVEVQERSSSG